MSRPAKGWDALLAATEREALSARLIGYAQQRRWFRGKSRSVMGAQISDVLPLDADSVDAAANVLVVVEVRYAAGEPDLYVIPLTWAPPEELRKLREKHPHTLIGTDDGLVDGLATGEAAVSLLDMTRGNLTRRGHHGVLAGEGSDLLAQLVADGASALPLRVAGVEQTNSTVMFGDRALLKIYRQPAAGPNVELEMGRFLDQACDPPCVPRVLGAITYQPDGGTPRSLGVVHQLIANRGDAWALAERELGRFFQRASDAPPPIELRRGGQAWLSAVDDEAGALDARAGRFVVLASVLGRRTGELHVALAGRRRPVPDAGDDFAPAPLTAEDRRALVDRTRSMLDDTLAALASSASAGRLGAASRPLAERILAPEGRNAVARLLREFSEQPIDTVKIRTHGDLHLGQVLAIARDAKNDDAARDDAAIDDFVIIDFEGEPARPLHERRAKGSPLRDVMGMVRSFDYAPEAALRHGGDSGGATRAGWARLWTRQVTASYLRAYLQSVAGAPFVPRDRAQLARLLTYYELEKVIYEVGYELNNRPDWLDIPLRGLLAVVGLGLESGT